MGVRVTGVGRLFQPRDPSDGTLVEGATVEEANRLHTVPHKQLAVVLKVEVEVDRTSDLCQLAHTVSAMPKLAPTWTLLVEGEAIMYLSSVTQGPGAPIKS